MSIHYGKNIKTRYFKGYIDNFFTVGTPTFEGNLASGFSTANYLETPKFPTNVTDLEMVWKVKFSAINVTQYFFNTAPYYSCLIGLINSKFSFWLSNNTASWDIVENAAGTTTPSIDTWYYIKFTYDGETYNLYLSTDNRSWTLEATLSSTKTIGVNHPVGRIGSGWSDSPSTNTTFDLSECYIKINGELWWNPYKRCKYDYNFTRVGTPSISNPPSCEVSGFNDVNTYLEIPTFPANTTNFEVLLKVKFINSKVQQYFFNLSWKYSFLLGVLSDGMFALYMSNNGSSWDLKDITRGSTVLANDTWYYIKCTFDGSEYKVELSTDCKNWNVELSVQSNKTIASGSGGRIGSGWQDSPANNIVYDLKESYIKINGELWWSCFKQSDDYVFSEESTSSDYDYTVFEDGKIKEFYKGALYRTDYYKGFINNFITVGTPTINKSLASGFTTVNNYLLIPAIPANITNFETILKVKFSNNTTNQHFFNTSHTYGFLLSLSNAGKLFVHISGNGTSWNIASNIHGTTVLSKDTWYYVKCSFDGSQYKVQLSTDKEIWTDEITINSTLTVGSVGGGRIGSGWQQDTPGSYITVDLNECYIKIADEYFWKNYKRCIYDYNFTTVGLPSVLTQDGNCTVTGFSSANYLTMPFTPSDLAKADNWEVVTCFTTSNNVTSDSIVFGGSSGTYVPDFGRVLNGKFGIMYSSNGSSANISGGDPLYGTYTVLPNTKYWVKQKFTGEEYTLDYSLDGEVYIRDITVTNSTKIEATNDIVYCGYCNARTNTHSSIDLTQFYIKINGELWWSCFKTSTDYVFSEKTTTDDYDYSKPYKGEIILGYKGETLVYSLYPNGVVFEENTAGTYTISPAISGPYEISLVGPGSGGTAAGDQPSYASKSRGAGGGSGAYVKGIWNLTRGVDYTIVVGAGGPAGPTTSNNGYSQAAGDSSFGDIIVCGGGGGATAVWKGSGIGGAGGTVKACENPIQLITRTAGNQGKAGGGYTYYAGAESVFPPHGAGGFGQATGNYAGKSAPGENGYCKVRMLTIKPEQQKINVNFVGNVKFDNGVVSNFTTTNYLMLPEIFNPGDKSWEIVFKFNRTSESGVYESFLGNNGSDYSNGVHVFKRASGELALECCTAGASSWNICAIIGTTVLELNKDYWVKAEFTGSSYNLYLSEDGVVYNLEASKESTTTIGATVVQLIGISKNNTATYFRGSIDLSECYIKSNGKYLWKGISNDNI